MAVFTALTAAIGGTFIGSLVVGGLKILVGIGLNKLAMKLAGKKPKGPQFSVKGELQRGADLSQTFLLGRAGTAGSLIYANTWGAYGGTPNAYLTMVIALSDLPVQSLDKLWVNGEQQVLLHEHTHADYGVPVDDFTTVSERPVYERQGVSDNATMVQVGTETVVDSHLWVKFYDGSQTAADQFLIDNVSTVERPWDATAIGDGLAYVVMTARLNRNLFSGFPDYFFELTGIPLYDPSQDTSVGGVGLQRYDDPTTWGGDGDHLPAVQLYNLFRGLWVDDDWFYGMQATSEAQVPVDHWIAQIEKCRTLINSQAGQEPRYRSGGEIAVNSPIVDAMDALLDACQGRLAESGGIYKLFVGEPDPAVVSFTDGNILSSEEQSFTPFFGLADTVNGISAKFPDPDQNWQTETAPPLYNSEFEVEDGNRRLMVDVNFDLVPYAEQVQRLMHGALKEARRARRHTFTLPPSYWPLEPGDVISWASARNGYVDKLFRVDGVADQPNADVTVDLTEIDPTDYDFDTVADYVAVVIGGTQPQPVPAQSVSGWAVSPVSITDESGTGRRPAIEVMWNRDVEDVTAVRVRVRLKSTQAMVTNGEHRDFAAGFSYITEGILPGAEYQVSGAFVPGTPRAVEWSVWLDVTAPDIRLDPADLSADVWTTVNADATARAGEVLQTFKDNEFADLQTDMTVLSDATDQSINTLTEHSEQAAREIAQSRDDLETLTENATAALVKLGNAETRMYDAGVRVDPDTGEVTIEGVARHDAQLITVEQRLEAAEGLLVLRATMVEVNQAIAAAQLTPTELAALDDVWTQINAVEASIDAINATLELTATTATTDTLNQQITQAQIQLDALAGEVETLVTTTEFTALETELTSVQETLSVLDVPGITRTVLDVQLQNDHLEKLAEQGIEAMLVDYNANLAGQQRLAVAKDELNAGITEANEAIALARTELGVGIGGAVAQIVEESTARTDGDTANAQSITALTATVDGHTSTITQQATTIAGLGGSIQYSINVDGHISGWALSSEVAQGGDPYAAFTFLTDAFQISSVGGGAVSPFIVYTVPTDVGGVIVPAGVYIQDAFIRNGVIASAHIGELQVDEIHLNNGAVSNWDFNSDETQFEITQEEQWVDLISVATTSVGGNHLIFIEVDTSDSLLLYAGQINDPGTQGTKPHTYEATLKFRLTRDTVPVGGVFFGDTTRHDAPPAGTYTYTLQGWFEGFTSYDTTQAQALIGRRALSVQEIKK